MILRRVVVSLFHATQVSTGTLQRLVTRLEPLMHLRRAIVAQPRPIATHTLALQITTRSLVLPPQIVTLMLPLAPKAYAALQILRSVLIPRSHATQAFTRTLRRMVPRLEQILQLTKPIVAQPRPIAIHSLALQITTRSLLLPPQIVALMLPLAPKTYAAPQILRSVLIPRSHATQAFTRTLRRMVPRLEQILQLTKPIVAQRWRRARLHPAPQARRVRALAHLPRR